jgi:hypothetical protein
MNDNRILYTYIDHKQIIVESVLYDLSNLL